GRRMLRWRIGTRDPGPGTRSPEPDQLPTTNHRPMPHQSTIAAIATGPGAAGIGVVRLSGSRAREIAQALCGRALRPRHAHYVRFRDRDGTVIDDGIALLFVAPACYTVGDLWEFQSHRCPPVLRQLT